MAAAMQAPFQSGRVGGACHGCPALLIPFQQLTGIPMVNCRKRAAQAARPQQCASAYARQHFTQNGRVPAATALHQVCASMLLTPQTCCCYRPAASHQPGVVFTTLCSARLVRCRASSDRSGAGFTSGFVVGGVLFGALGFLFAPQVRCSYLYGLLCNGNLQCSLDRHAREPTAGHPHIMLQCRRNARLL